MLAALPASAESVDVELVLLADASGSIDTAELRFQRQGYAEAMRSPEVLAAIAGGLDGRIAVTYVEWAAESSQDVVVPWQIVDGRASAAAFGEALLAAPRRAFGRNAIGSAIAVGHALIETNAYQGFRRVIDVSADSSYSWGGIPLPEARAAALEAGIVINGLAVLCLAEDCSGRPMRGDLEGAFAERIIGGPGSFVVTARDRASFVDAVRQKLVLEIAGLRPEPGERQAARH
ncbi:MAG: DUF1194 domain-containing protein [Pseudomonadota bacterium]